MWFLFSQVIWGQTDVAIFQQELWGDYYFINQKYKKSIAYYESYDFDLNLSQRRNFARAYLFNKDFQKAVDTYGPVANSEEATVEDYYQYADLLKNQTSLALEYRTKAYRLPWGKPSLYDQDSLLYKKRFGEKIYRVVNLVSNTNDNEYGLLFMPSHNQSEVFFLSDQKVAQRDLRRIRKFNTNFPVYNFYRASLESTQDKLTRIEPLPKSINTVFQEGSGNYDPTRKTFYFTRSNPKFDKTKTAQLSIYSIELEQIDQDRIALPLPFNLADYSTLHPATSPSESRLYFASDRPGGFGGMDLYYVEIKGNEFSAPVNLGPDINSSADEVFPFVYKKGILFYSSNREKGRGGLDVYLAQHRIEKRWETFVLGEGINTPKDDFSFGLSEQESLGYFSSNREGGKGGDDLYTFSFSPKIEGVNDYYTYSPADTLIVAMKSVLVNDQEKMNTQDPLQRIISKHTELAIAPKNGELYFNKNGSFWYKNQRPTETKDSFAYRVISTKGKSEITWVMLDRSEVEKQELTSELKSTFASIFFNYGESQLLTYYEDRVKKVVEAMNNNPQMQIEVSSYTDCRGTADFNLQLSKRRTQEIITYVRSRINRPERIFGGGYGEYIESRNNFMLIAGSFDVPQYAQKFIKQLQNIGFADARIKQIGEKFRVIASEGSSKENLSKNLKILSGKNIAGWIVESDCTVVSEQEHQKNRRTDFKVIKR